MTNPNRWKQLAGILTEASTIHATNDSLDGPYTELEDEQPMDVDKNINRELVEDKYPETASEYAKQLNAENPESWMKLADDEEHWAQYGVKTGKELAHYLAVEEHRDAFKHLHGVRPRHVDYDKLSIEEIEAKIASLHQAIEEEDQEEEFWDDLNRHRPDEDEAEEPKDELDVEFGKYEDIEADWDEKIRRSR